MKKFAKSLEFERRALEDLLYWVQKDPRKAGKILELALEVMRDFSTGVGKPELLKYELIKCWSRRIDLQHRMIYTVTSEKVRILSCRLHYE